MKSRMNIMSRVIRDLPIKQTSKRASKRASEQMNISNASLSRCFIHSCKDAGFYWIMDEKGKPIERWKTG